ncbi:B12-binding domain/radical SAM domain-containing protein [Neorhizobium sp. DAR64860/K0K1]|uniref:B12-binding domain/radical SAM domain-containing protein n=1 Tax=Neorhizobium sp. DAR64860/K0K1 TaxID=3421955 RepID=UPI003D2AD940
MWDKSDLLPQFSRDRVGQDARSSLVSPKLRAIAVAAPDWISGNKSSEALNSTDPASLFNACRLAASKARLSGNEWSASNWSGGRSTVRDKFLLMYSLDDLPRFKDLILRERPNLLLIGAMTLCMPGAVECATIARELLGDEVLIVLGGRHPSETLYLTNERIRAVDTVQHHTASPGGLIRRGSIPPVFDVVISGDGEHVIFELGRCVVNQGPADHFAISSEIVSSIPGNWIADFPVIDRLVVSNGMPVAYDTMGALADVFGVSASFDVFEGRKTAHVFSDTGRGCVYDCSFCSERRGVTGGIQDIKGAPWRLYNQMIAAVRVIKEDCPGWQASAFVEDSIFLSGSPVAIEQFCQLMESDPIDIVFGCQFTIDQVIRRQDLIRRLSSVGLRYVFIGLETFDPDEIGGMSKDIGGRTESWQNRFSKVMQIFAANDISVGCALLFGLGEPHSSRLALLDRLIVARREQGQPLSVSANWAVQHPLRSIPESQGEDYLRWGTPPGPMLTAFHRFGEASVEYPLAGVAPPDLPEVIEVIRMLDRIADA